MLGYFRFPVIHKDQLYFVSEDDLWSVDLDHKKPAAKRLTAGLGQISSIALSHDGKQIALGLNEEGHCEVFVLPAEGGMPKRLTYLGDQANVCSWLHDGRVAFTSAHGQPFSSMSFVYAVDPDTLSIEKLNTGMASRFSVSHERKIGRVIQRHGNDFGAWKRYRGGTAGQIWVDESNTGEYRHILKNLDSNFSNPLWIGDRIFFLSDHEGVGNIYSCWTDGEDLRRETDHEHYYTRHITTDGENIVFHRAGNLFLYDPRTGVETEIDFDYIPSGLHTRRRFVDVRGYVDAFDPHPGGHHLAFTARASAFIVTQQHGSATTLPRQDEERFCFPRWVGNGEKLLHVKRDEKGDHLQLLTSETHETLSTLSSPTLGRICQLEIAPKTDKAIITNQRNELILVDFNRKKPSLHVIERSEHGLIGGLSWSPDGQWLAYDFPLSIRQRVIKLLNIQTQKTTTVTSPVLQDFSPSFDPEGKYLFFLSNRALQPSWDTHHFEVNFPGGIQPFSLTLQKETAAPCRDYPPSLSEGDDEEPAENKEKSEKNLDIHFDHIYERITPLPLPHGQYQKLSAGKGRLYLLKEMEASECDEEDNKGASLFLSFDLENRREEVISADIQDFRLSTSKNWGVFQDIEGDFRLFKTAEKLEECDDVPAHKQGWVHLNKVQAFVDPQTEWQQIYGEAWQLQKDFFWTEDMSKVDWEKVRNRYLSLSKRVLSRTELNDLLWQMQGELGSSHAYVVGGDIKDPFPYHLGKLGAFFHWDHRKKAYVIHNIAQGDSWSTTHASPLRGPGIHIEDNTEVVSIDGVTPTKALRPEECLMNKANSYIKLVYKDPSGRNEKSHHIKTLRSDRPLRYRDWVEQNRTYVHQKSKGRLGYIHVPDMVLDGYREFHRSFLAEHNRDGLIIDVRFNRGGSISSLLIEKLYRKRLGYDISRWNGAISYPFDAPHGAMVTLTNEYAGSDGDMFCHVFKMLKMGPLIGQRTWGGVIGIEPQHRLIDNGYTTQPEFSMWFSDVQWAVENKGVTPDILVEMTALDYETNKDPQLDRSIEECLLQVKEKPPLKPQVQERPDLSLPHTVG